MAAGRGRTAPGAGLPGVRCTGWLGSVSHACVLPARFLQRPSVSYRRAVCGGVSSHLASQYHGILGARADSCGSARSAFVEQRCALFGISAPPGSSADSDGAAAPATDRSGDADAGTATRAPGPEAGPGSSAAAAAAAAGDAGAAERRRWREERAAAAAAGSAGPGADPGYEPGSSGEDAGGGESGRQPGSPGSAGEASTAVVAAEVAPPGAERRFHCKRNVYVHSTLCGATLPMTGRQTQCRARRAQLLRHGRAAYRPACTLGTDLVFKVWHRGCMRHIALACMLAPAPVAQFGLSHQRACDQCQRQRCAHDRARRARRAGGGAAGLGGGRGRALRAARGRAAAGGGGPRGRHRHGRRGVRCGPRPHAAVASLREKSLWRARGGPLEARQGGARLAAHRPRLAGLGWRMRRRRAGHGPGFRARVVAQL